VVLVGAIMLYAAPQRWSSGWMELVTTQREYLVLLWPLAATAGAYQARREHRSQVDELFASTARPRLQRVAPTLGALAISVAAGYLLLIVTAAPWIWSTARYLPVAAFVIAGVGVLSVVTAAWLGLGVGRLLPSPVTAPLLGVAALAFLFFLPFAFDDWLGALISPMHNMSTFHDWQTISGRVSAAQGIWMVALAVAGVVLLAAGTRRARVAALLPVALGLTVGVAVMPRGDAYVSPLTDPVAQQMVCTPDLPVVCLTRAHEGLLPEVVPHARKALGLLAKVPGGPTRAEEQLTDFGSPRPTPPHDPTIVLMSIGVDREGHLAWPALLVPRMLDAAGADGQHCEQGGASTEVARAIGSWLSGTEPVPDPTMGESPDINATAVANWTALRQLPEQQALAKVQAVREAVLACRQEITLGPAK